MNDKDSREAIKQKAQAILGAARLSRRAPNVFESIADWAREIIKETDRLAALSQPGEVTEVVAAHKAIYGASTAVMDGSRAKFHDPDEKWLCIRYNSYTEMLAAERALRSLEAAALGAQTRGEGRRIAKMREILYGIDKTETEDKEGWWPTSTGAEFGREVLGRLEFLFAACPDEQEVGGGEDNQQRAAA